MNNWFVVVVYYNGQIFETEIGVVFESKYKISGRIKRSINLDGFGIEY